MQKTSFNPLPSLEQSSPKGQERTSCALKILTQTTWLLCNVIIYCFPAAYFCKYLQEVFIISMTVSPEKKELLKVFFMVTLTIVYSRTMKQQLTSISIFTQEGCRSGMLAHSPMPKEWYLFRGTRKTVRLRVPSSAVSKVSACAGW